MNIYYIDYENVTSQGLKGIELLTESDEVNLLYSKKAETMKIDILTQLLASRAKIHFIPVHVGTPNALDFQLITLLFLHYSPENMHYIISKDSGYDCCIKTAAENDAPNVLRFPTIESAARGMKPDRQQRSGRRSGGRQNRQNAAPQEGNANAIQQTDVFSQPKTVSEQSEMPLQAADLTPAGNEHPEDFSERADAVQQTDADGQVQQADPDGQVQQADTDSPVQQADTDSPVQQPDADSPVQQADPDDQVQQDGADSRMLQPEQVPNGASDAPQQEETGKKRPARRRGRRKAAASQAEAEPGRDSQAEEAPENQKGDPLKGASQKQDNRKSDNQKQDNQKPVTVLSVIRRRNDVQLDLNQIDLIRNALKSSSNKQQFYNFFVKKLGQKKGIELYHSIKSSYTDLINANLI